MCLALPPAKIQPDGKLSSDTGGSRGRLITGEAGPPVRTPALHQSVVQMWANDLSSLL